MEFSGRNSKSKQDLTSVVAPYRNKLFLLTPSYLSGERSRYRVSLARDGIAGEVTGPVETDRVAVEIVSGRPRQTGSRGQVSNQATPRRTHRMAPGTRSEGLGQ